MINNLIRYSGVNSETLLSVCKVWAVVLIGGALEWSISEWTERLTAVSEVLKILSFMVAIAYTIHKFFNRRK